MNPQISVLMCAYNTEGYVEKAIRSILNQTFSDFEFLVIDNGSTDCTGTIIDRLSQEDDRISVVHNDENEPPSESLNTAMQRAEGRYLYIIDSDDWAEPELLDKMYQRAEKHDAQLVYTGFYMDYCIKKKTYSFVVSPDDTDYTQQTFHSCAINDITRMMLGVYWNKLVCLDYIREKGIRFQNTKMFDFHFNMDILMDVERVSSVGLPLYHYIRIRDGSYMKSDPGLNQKKRDHFVHTMKVYEHWGVSDNTMAKLAGYHLAQLIRCVIDTVNGNGSKAYKKRELEKIFSDEWTIFALENRPNGLKTTVFALLLRSRSYMLCRMFGWLAGSFERFMPGTYYAVRAAIAQKGEKNKAG